jgi:hypothetical protein
LLVHGSWLQFRQAPLMTRSSSHGRRKSRQSLTPATPAPSTPPSSTLAPVPSSLPGTLRFIQPLSSDPWLTQASWKQDRILSQATPHGETTRLLSLNVRSNTLKHSLDAVFQRPSIVVPLHSSRPASGRKLTAKYSPTST